ncbi:MAG: gephyrin-like molybdotransferase Glp [Dongiaceae bacterium]
MISVAEALQRILGALAPLGAEQIALNDALGRVLATDLESRVTQPPVAVSAMDGYAVRAADVATVPATLAVIGEAPAGRAFAGKIGPGEAVRIFTGGPVPNGADAIVIQENTDAEGTRVIVKETVKSGLFVRPAGLDFKTGHVLLKRGRRLTARDVGLAAAMNRPWLQVHRQPRVAILSSGDEIVMPGEPIGPSQIVSSNGIGIAAFVRACGGIPIDLGVAPDNLETLKTMTNGAAAADLLVTTGGVSVGDHDLMRAALGAKGMALDFWKIAMRPGKPLMFGKVDGTPVLGLPGNPVSTLVCSTIFLRPALALLEGVADPVVPRERARLGKDLPENDRREDYLRARLERTEEGGLVATAFDRQDSSMLSFLAGADCLIARAPLAPALKAGSEIEIVPLAGGAFGI